MDNDYNFDFYKFLGATSSRSASYVVPLLCNSLKPSSVLDVGCGEGAWLAEFRRYGTSDIFGVDGPWVQTDRLLIGEHQFRNHDLTKHIDLGRRFELAVCLEVAEHLPASSADVIVDTLTSHSDIVVFSAAVPGQGGTGHLNEQWPSYWSKLFADRGYSVYDVLRPLLWDVNSVDWWYAQNAFIYARPSSELAIQELLGKCLYGAFRSPTAAVHFRAAEYRESRSFENAGFVDTVRSIPKKLLRAFNRRT